MIPVQLSLQGLYSYKEKQTIDFQPLIAAGLFGLFGAVGSGKSSILEAIMLALYNKTERLTHVGRNYNIMNLQSNELVIDFIFYSGVANKEKFRASYTSRRNRKDFTDVAVKERCYYKWEENRWVPLENLDNATSILGMSYENFMKTVIIPQGKFREFVDQTTSARTQMLKELFPLDKFDLYNKTGKLLNQAKADIQAVSKLLDEIGALGKEDIVALEQEIIAIAELQKESTESLKKLRKVEEQLRALEKIFNAFYEVAENLNHLKADQELFKSKEIQLNTYTKAYTYFREKLSLLANQTEELKVKKAHIEGLHEQLKKVQSSLSSVSIDFQKAKEDLGKVEETKLKCEDLKLIIEIGKSSKAVHAMTIQSTKANEALSLLQQQLTASKERETKIEEKIKEQELLLLDMDNLTEIARWLEKEADFLKEKEEKALLHTQLIQRKAALKASVGQALSPLGLAAALAKQGNPTTLLAVEREKIQAKIEDLQHKLVPLQVKEQLSAYASALEEGNPCPLCGATHHPDTAEHATVTKEIKDAEQVLFGLKREEKQIGVVEQEIQGIHLKMARNDELISNIVETQQKLEDKINNHAKQKPEIPAGLDNVHQVNHALSEKLKIRKSLAEDKTFREKLKHAISETESELEAKRNVLQEAKQQQAAEEAKVVQMKKMLKIYDYKRFERHTLEELTASMERGLERITHLNQNYEKLSAKVQEKEQSINTIKGQLGAEEVALGELVNKTTLLDDEVQQLLKEKGFVSVYQVKEILRMNLNIDRERQEIDLYKNNLLKVEQQYFSLKKEIANREYQPAHHQEIIEEIEDLEEKQKQMQSALSVKHKEIEDIEKKIKRREILHKELENLELRKQNLSELCNLFRGNGFMNYVSSLYLENLCKAANERFLKLTKNNLSLELNEQNDFIVRDYLNNGKTRLLKTLSGGQTFQASLCLALALAENVKVLNQAEQSFFFLDEGFGALDKRSLTIVFDTLKTLRKENRVVGIISHVEELQQEIDIYLEVENDREKGSQVSFSWK